MKKLLVFMLAFAMILTSFSACKPEKKPSDTTASIETTHETEPATEPGTEPVTEPVEREPLIPALPEDAEVLTFRYEEKWRDLYNEKLEEYKNIALTAEEYAQLEVLDADMEELSTFLDDQHAIAMILYYCDMSDEEAEKRYLDMVDVMTDLGDKSTKLMQEIYNSDSKIKDEIFADMTEEELQLLVNYDSEIADLMKRNEEILVEYHDLEDPSTDKKVGTFYGEIVKNNNAIAELYGYDNYYSYAYTMKYSRDYTPQDVVKMREYVIAYLVPVFEAAATSFMEKAYDLSTREAQAFSDFAMEDYDMVEYLDLYTENLPQEVSGEMLDMFEGHCVFPRSSDAYDGAFTTTISGEPFSYFSKDYKTTSTIVHEMGHYYGALYGDLSELPLDLAEIQSQGNEWLMISAIKEEMNGDAYEAYLDYRIVMDIGTILLSMIVDEFEQRVYENPNVATFTAKDFDRIMKDVCKNYGGYDFISEALADPLIYWRLVALEQPVYYISYAVSMIPSMDIHFVAEEDWDSALEIYLGLTRDVPEEGTFLEILQGAGLATPFEDKVYKALAEYYDLDIPEQEQAAA